MSAHYPSTSPVCPASRCPAASLKRGTAPGSRSGSRSSPSRSMRRRSSAPLTPTSSRPPGTKSGRHCETCQVKCQACGDESIGRCEGCWEFYCAHHSSVVCDNCARREAGENGIRYVKVVAKQLKESDLARREAVEEAAPNRRKLMRWTTSGRDRLERVIGV